MKNLTVIFLCLLLASVTLGCGKKNGIRATYAGNINTYCEMKDGTWSCNDRSYEYRLERRGRLPNAECDSVFVYLSNLPDISFEQAAKASGLSSDTADYFAAEDAVLVELRTEFVCAFEAQTGFKTGKTAETVRVMFVGTQVDTMSCKGADSVCCPLSCVFLCLYYAGSW